LIHKKQFTRPLLCVAALACGRMFAQNHLAAAPVAELRLGIVSAQPGKHHAMPAVIWLTPIHGTPVVPFPQQGHYTLLQKNRTFIPHLLVVPVGSAVQFPNADPFFHNVFSQFDGKRFDLGLYEAGSSKTVTFTREGVSYIFCNIHPEMSAVVLSLATSLYAVADATDTFELRNIPPGDYNLHLWIEGVPQPILESLNRPIHLSSGRLDLGVVSVPKMPAENADHMNKFGKPYDSDSKSPYER
jgi:hypothetical protein